MGVPASARPNLTRTLGLAVLPRVGSSGASRLMTVSLCGPRLGLFPRIVPVRRNRLRLCLDVRACWRAICFFRVVGGSACVSRSWTTMVLSWPRARSTANLWAPLRCWLTWPAVSLLSRPGVRWTVVRTEKRRKGGVLLEFLTSDGALTGSPLSVVAAVAEVGVVDSVGLLVGCGSRCRPCAKMLKTGRLAYFRRRESNPRPRIRPPRDSYTYPLNLKGDGSPAGMPAWWRSKWRSDGVMVSWRAWSGVRDASPLPASR